MATQDAVTSNVDRLTGMVKWFNNKAGFGFITVCSPCDSTGKDIFVHFSAIRAKLYKYLVQGEYVEFVLVKSDNDKHEYTAQDITGLMCGPIMCETRRLSATYTQTEEGPNKRPYRPRQQEESGNDGDDHYQTVESPRRRPTKSSGPRKVKESA